MYWNVPEMSKFMKFLKFLAFPGHSGTFWSKMTQKMVKKYTKIFDFLPKMADFWPFDSYQKGTELFVFRLLAFPVHFPKKTRDSETVTKRHELN